MKVDNLKMASIYNIFAFSYNLFFYVWLLLFHPNLSKLRPCDNVSSTDEQAVTSDMACLTTHHAAGFPVGEVKARDTLPTER